MAVDINWGALGASNPMMEFTEGLEMGRQRRRQEENDAFVRQDRERRQRLDEAELVRRMDEQQKAEAKARNEQLATYAYSLKKLPYEQRKQRLSADLPRLTALGFEPEQIESFDPSDDGIDGVVAQTMSLSDLLAREDKERATAFEREKFEYTKQKDATTPLALDPEKNYFVRDTGAAPPSGGAGFDAVIGPLLQREGGYVAKDGRSGAPANFGINQKFNPDIDVRNLTPERAKAIYRERYWNAIDGDNLPPEAQSAVFDAAVNQGPDTALAMWREAGGDVQRFADIRLARYRQTPGYEEAGRSWERRVAETTPGALQGGPGADTIAPPPGMRLVQAAKPKEPEWQADGKGLLVNTKTGDRKRDPSFESEGMALPPETGLTPIGDPARGVYRNAVGQKFQTNRTGTIQRLAGPTDTQVGDAEKKIKAINETMTLVDAVDEQLARTRVLGPGGRYIVNQQEFAKLDSLTKQLQIAFKNAAELGAITGPDVPFIEAVAPNPRELRSLVQRGEYKPRLQSLAKVAGSKYRGETAAFKALGGDPAGLTPLYRSPRSKVAYDREGRYQRRSPAAALPPQAAQQLKEGQITTFGNGQSWTLRGGKAQRVR